MEEIVFEQHLEGQVMRGISNGGNGVNRDMDARENKIFLKENYA